MTRVAKVLGIGQGARSGERPRGDGPAPQRSGASGGRPGVRQLQEGARRIGPVLGDGERLGEEVERRGGGAPPAAWPGRRGRARGGELAVGPLRVAMPAASRGPARAAAHGVVGLRRGRAGWRLQRTGQHGVDEDVAGDRSAVRLPGEGDLRQQRSRPAVADEHERVRRRLEQELLGDARRRSATRRAARRRRAPRGPRPASRAREGVGEAPPDSSRGEGRVDQRDRGRHAEQCADCESADVATAEGPGGGDR